MNRALGSVLLLVALFGATELRADPVRVEVAIEGMSDPGVVSVAGVGAGARTEAIAQGDGSTLTEASALDAGQLVLTRPFTASGAFLAWFNTAAGMASAPGATVRRDVRCRQRIGAGTGLHVVYVDAFPVRYVGPELGSGEPLTESLTLACESVFTLLAPDPFKLTQVVIGPAEIRISWEGDLGGGAVEAAPALDVPEEDWVPVSKIVITHENGTGMARIPRGQFPGNAFFFRVRKP